MIKLINVLGNNEVYTQYDYDSNLKIKAKRGIVTTDNPRRTIEFLINGIESRIMVKDLQDRKVKIIVEDREIRLNDFDNYDEFIEYVIIKIKSYYENKIIIKTTNINSIVNELLSIEFKVIKQSFKM